MTRKRNEELEDRMLNLVEQCDLDKRAADEEIERLSRLVVSIFFQVV